MFGYMKFLAALGIGIGSLLAHAQSSSAQQNPVTAIDIALEPDATMMQHAKADNARLLKAFPKGFALDATHHARVTMLQQFVRTDDLDKVYAAANKVLAKEKPTGRMLKAFKYYYIPSPPVGLAGIVVEPTEDLHQAATRANRSGCALHGQNRDPGSVHEHRGWPRHPAVLDRLRGQFCDGRSWQEIQSARHNWCRHRSLLERNARGAVRGVHVLASLSVGLPTGQFWHSSQGTQGLGVEALSALRERTYDLGCDEGVRLQLSKRNKPCHRTLPS